MEHIYIDESGSMTAQYADNNPYFVVALVRCKDASVAKKLHKRFVKKHMAELQRADREGRMFKDGKFKELKGAMFTPQLKRDFMSFFCRENGNIEVFYILIRNDRISGPLYDNTARAFNYTLKLALHTLIRRGLLPDDSYSIQLDERNERTQTRHFLKAYLNTELRMDGTVSSEIDVKYFDSSRNRLVQLADVFANIYYSHLMTEAYGEHLQSMRDSGCLRFVFEFPLS